MQQGKISSLGHRQRLRTRFLRSGLEGFLDYEVIELLLTLATPRRDCKQQAKAAISKFGSLKKTLEASAVELSEVSGLGPTNILGILLFQSLQERYAKETIENKLSLNSPSEIASYVKAKIGNEKQEHFIIMFFNTRNELITSDISVGTINASLVHPREVFNEAISQHASHIVVAHNHPSGDPTPSDEDIITTRRLVEAGKIIGINLVDHLVVSINGHASFRELRLLD